MLVMLLGYIQRAVDIRRMKRGQISYVSNTPLRQLESRNTTTDSCDNDEDITITWCKYKHESDNHMKNSRLHERSMAGHAHIQVLSMSDWENINWRCVCHLSPARGERSRWRLHLPILLSTTAKPKHRCGEAQFPRRPLLETTRVWNRAVPDARARGGI